MTISSRRDGVILIITVDNPPVNALGHSVRSGLLEALQEGERDPLISAMVVRCAGKTFFAGADITEFGKPPVAPTLSDLCNLIEAITKPVIAAIHGTALGGGLEVALACHYRIAAQSAQLGLPEVKLGLLPGAGGTQRLPRLVGMASAVEMIALGGRVPAISALDMGLVDRAVADEELPCAATEFARAIATARPLPRTGAKRVEADVEAIAAFKEANARKLRGLDAPAASIEAVMAAAEMPLEKGLAFERQLFAKLLAGEQSAALRYGFFAERRASKIENMDLTMQPLPIASTAVIGAGTMGSGIALTLLNADLPVVLLEANAEALERGMATIRQSLQANVSKGRMSRQAMDRALRKLTTAREYSALSDCDLIIEAVFELMEVKHEVFGQLDRAAKPGAILATNTSYLDVDAIAGFTRRPECVIGLHFFSPANIMKLLEVVRGARTAPQVLVTAMALAKHIGKTAVVSGVCHGFIGNRMLAQRRAQAFELLLEGATPKLIDDVHVAFGMPMGPFQMSDLAGVDIGWHRNSSRIENVRDALCAAGRFGQKAGKGYYDYDDQRRPRVSAEAQAIIDDFARSSGTPRSEVSSIEILERTLFAMVNEGARILTEGIAQRASDIDVVWVNGYGWPAYRGGPMYWADQVGLAKVAERLIAYGIPVAPLLAEKASTGARFTD